jgi:nucleotide-binding universal stress UspA family protein
MTTDSNPPSTSPAEDGSVAKAHPTVATGASTAYRPALVELSTDRIVVGVDGSAASIAGFRHGVTISRALKVPLQAISVWSFPLGMMGVYPPEYSPEHDALDQLKAVTSTIFDGEVPDDIIQTAIEGYPAEVLIGVSDSAAMLIVGSRGRGEVASLLLGSVSAECAEKAHCPVLIVHETSVDSLVQDAPDASSSDTAAAVLIAAR